MPEQDLGFLEIDENDLQKAWVDQVRLRYEYGAKLSAARKVHDERKGVLAIKTAEISLDIRTHPENYTLPKITEDVVKAAVLVQDEYKQALQDLIDARYDLEMLENAVDALEHKKKALENIVSLTLSELRSEPRSPRINGEQYSGSRKKATYQEASEGLNKEEGD